VTNIWGDGAHSAKQLTAAFPDVMRWLWRDWPQPIKANESKNDTLTNILIPGEDWQIAAEGLGGSDGPAVNAQGEVFFSESRSNRIWKISTDGKRELLSTQVQGVTGLSVGPRDQIYSVGHSGLLLVCGMETNTPADKRMLVIIADKIFGNDLVVAHNGNIYVTDPPASTNIAPSKIWLIKPTGEKSVVDTGLKYANGLALSPDQSLLYVAEYRSHWVYSYVIQPDGTLTNKQKYYWLHERDVDDDSGADGMRVDRAGRLYVATRMGIQVCD